MKLTYRKNGKVVFNKTVEDKKPVETPEQKYARTHPQQHRGISGCCDSALNPPIEE